MAADGSTKAVGKPYSRDPLTSARRTPQRHLQHRCLITLGNTAFYRSKASTRSRSPRGANHLAPRVRSQLPISLRKWRTMRGKARILCAHFPPSYIPTPLGYCKLLVESHQDITENLLTVRLLIGTSRLLPGALSQPSLWITTRGAPRSPRERLAEPDYTWITAHAPALRSSPCVSSSHC